MKPIVVIGGGAAGVFCSIQIKEHFPDQPVYLLEKTKRLLAKVKISGGGRCNVTHHQFDVAQLVKNYPRGKKELISAFQVFQPKDMIQWLENHGVELKVESDGRVFPKTDSSETIMACFTQLLKKFGVEVKEETTWKGCVFKEDSIQVITEKGEIDALAVVVATGSNPKNSEIFDENQIAYFPLVPSLFTFHLPDSFLKQLSGTVIANGELKILNTPFKQQGPILLTHFGLSGPCCLKLSAFAALYLNEVDYQAELSLNFDASTNAEEKFQHLLLHKKKWANKNIDSIPLFGLTRALYQQILDHLKINRTLKWKDVPDKTWHRFAQFLTHYVFKMNGKTLFKEEFVSAGGVDLSVVNLKTMEHKTIKRLFFSGEVLNVDGVTGGFNFQNAWTTAYLAAQGVARYL